LLVVENDNIRHDPMKTATAVFNYILRWYYVERNRVIC
jgi:hypothetical protein